MREEDEDKTSTQEMIWIRWSGYIFVNGAREPAANVRPIKKKQTTNGKMRDKEELITREKTKYTK